MSEDDRNILERRGRIELSKYWPDGSRFRRVFPNKVQARKMRSQIETAINSGTWLTLKQELSRAEPKQDLTLTEFSEVFLEHCRKKNRRCDFHEEEIGRLLPVVGAIRLKQFSRADAVRLQQWRAKSVSGATVNRMMDVLSSMLSHALHLGLIASHPMTRFPSYPEESRALRVMSIEEEREFIAVLLKLDPLVGAFAGIMGETALRCSEAERLEWRHVDLVERILAVDRTKGKRPRYVPISDFAKDLFDTLPRVADSPYCFVRLETFKPLQDVRASFARAQLVTGMGWVHPEDFRHFRATQWVTLGVDLKTVQQLLGHADIHTTMRYAHFAPHHAARSIVEAQREEAAGMRQLVLGFTGPKQDREVTELERLYALESSKIVK